MMTQSGPCRKASLRIHFLLLGFDTWATPNGLRWILPIRTLHGIVPCYHPAWNYINVINLSLYGRYLTGVLFDYLFAANFVLWLLGGHQHTTLMRWRDLLKDIIFRCSQVCCFELECFELIRLIYRNHSMNPESVIFAITDETISTALFFKRESCLNWSFGHLDLLRLNHGLRMFLHLSVFDDKFFVEVPDELGDSLGKREAGLAFCLVFCFRLKASSPATFVVLAKQLEGGGKTRRLFIYLFFGPL